MKRLIAMITVTAALSAGCSNRSTSTTPTTEPSPSSDILVVACAESTDSSKDEGQADLEMRDFAFAPNCLQIRTEQGLRLHNEGGSKHNFSVQGFGGLDVDVDPGQENNTEATGLEPGKYGMFCKFHRESYDMKGSLTVVEA